MKTTLDLKNEKLLQIESDPKFVISKNVLIALEVLTDDEYDKTINAILSLKNDNLQESPNITKMNNSSKNLYATRVDSSIILLFCIEEDGIINVTNLMRKERIQFLYEQLHEDDKVSEIWRRIFTNDN